MHEIDPSFNLVKLGSVYKSLRSKTRNFEKLIVRDPTDYLDYRVESEANLIGLIQSVKKGNYAPEQPYIHESPKKLGISRPTIVLSIEDAILYRYCIESIEKDLLRKTKINKNIYGGASIKQYKKVFRDDSADDEFYLQLYEQWLEYNYAIKSSLLFSPYMVTTDIASYFENISTLVLKDQLRSDIDDKSGILNLLFYILEKIGRRDGYEVNPHIGLPQEDIDCSRLLAYYYLNRLDTEVSSYVVKNGGHFFRFVDDMTILVSSDIEGKKALRIVAGAMRKLGLSASIEKTSIINSAEAYKELFFSENELIDEYEKALARQIKNEEDLTVMPLIISNFQKLIASDAIRLKSWEKVLKRYYSLASQAGSTFLFEYLPDHLIVYPKLASDYKIMRMLVSAQRFHNVSEQVGLIINYLRSEDNLYPAVESRLIETILQLEDSIDETERKKVQNYANELLLGISGLSDYSKALAALLIYKFNRSAINVVAKRYLQTQINDEYVKKYYIFVGLCSDNINTQTSVLAKAKTEREPGIRRLVNLVENIGLYSKEKLFKEYLKSKEIFIYEESKDKLIPNYQAQKSARLKIKITYTPVRAAILKELHLKFAK